MNFFRKELSSISYMAFLALITIAGPSLSAEENSNQPRDEELIARGGGGHAGGAGFHGGGGVGRGGGAEFRGGGDRGGAAEFHGAGNRGAYGRGYEHGYDRGRDYDGRGWYGGYGVGVYPAGGAVYYDNSYYDSNSYDPNNPYYYNNQYYYQR